MATASLPTFTSGKLTITYRLVLQSTPLIHSILYDNNDLGAVIRALASSTFTGVSKAQPFKERIALDPGYEKISYDVFSEIIILGSINPGLAIGCADFFFNTTCEIYWGLIVNQGNKNLACAFLEEICLLVSKWEKKTGQRIHKGTLYFFLTFVYREMGDIDSAFASAFKAIEEDKKSFDPILGAGAYRNSPAYKYSTLVNDKSNYLYEVVSNLRAIIGFYLTSFNKKTGNNLTLSDFDAKFLNNSNFESLSQFFVFSLEEINKYLQQLSTLPKNDFFRMKNVRDLFNICLIIDKLLQAKYLRAFRRRTKRPMFISDGVVLFFEEKGWITLTNTQKADPKRYLNINPSLPDEAEKIIDALVIKKTPLTFNTVPLNDEMRYVLLAYALRNIGAHEFKKRNIFVEKYEKIIESFFFAMFIVISSF